MDYYISGIDEIIKSSKIPVLVLDPKWHRLFDSVGKPEKIIELEEKVNNFLKVQGGLQNELKELKALKNKMLREIINNMEGTENLTEKKRLKKIEQTRKYVNEINMKISDAETELMIVPSQLKLANDELMIETVKICYSRLTENRAQSGELEGVIKSLRIELKKNIVLKQDLDTETQRMYSYMHDIVGTQLMNHFDAIDNKNEENTDENNIQ